MTPLEHRDSWSDLTVLQETLDDVYGLAGVKPDPETVVDIGANIGAFTVSACARWPKCKVIALEPDPENFALASRNTEPYTERVSLSMSAVWSDAGGISLEGEHGLAHVVSAGPTPSITLDELLADLAEVDVLKCDTEGSEFQIFPAASEATMRKIKYLALELHDYYGDEARDDLLDTLARTHALRSQDYRRHAGGVYTGWRR